MSESTIDDILHSAQSKVQEILQQKVDELQEVIAENKASTEALMELRIQYAQQQHIAEQHTQQLAQLQPSVQSLETEVHDLEQQHQQLNLHIQQQIRNKQALHREVEKYEAQSQQRDAELETLRSNAESLRAEVQKKEGEVQLLQERIEGMRKLRDEHMLSIMNLTNELSNISSGASDSSS